MAGSRISLHLLLIYTFFMTTGANEWEYTGEYGPSHWSDDSPQCAGTYQSPINIVTNEVLIDPLLQMLEFTGYGQTLEGGTFINNGHSVQLNLSTNKTFKISGGAMGDTTYTALQLHFHWSAPGSSDGSEHTVDGKYYPAEMHIVHIKDPYTSTDQVKDMPDGLAVLGVFLDVGEEENLAYGELFMTAKDCKYKGMEATLHLGPRLFSLLPDSGSFYRYSGSLTTPPCYETVTWTVLQNPVMISEKQLEILQSLKSVSRPEAAKEALDGMDCKGDNCDTRHKRAVNTTNNAANSLGGNYRPTEPLNGRIVTSYLDMRYVKIGHSHDWTYHDHLSGTTKWSKSYPTCGKKSQSPINIDTSSSVAPEVVDSSGLAEAMVFTGYDSTLKGTFVNNGHAVQLNFDSDLKYVITKGGLNSSYTAVQLHFHWGEAFSDSGIRGGSEHTVDNKRYDAEMHIVHGKTSEMTDLTSYRETAADAYAVLGVFVKVFQNESEASSSDDGANAHMQELFEAIDKVRFSGDESAFLSGPSLKSLLPDDQSFYRYEGSLTTPPCSESVIWTVFSEPIIISLNQFIAFQRLFNVDAAQVPNHSSIKVKKEMALVDDVSNNGKSKTEPEIPDAASSPENAGKEALDSLKSTSGKSTSYTLAANITALPLLRNNYRPVQQLNNRTVHYYDLSGTTATTGEPTKSAGLPVWEIVVFACAGIVVFVIFLIIVTRCTCKKNKKAKYSAGQREGNEAITL